MCIFARPVQSVGQTKIFARQTPSQHQCLVYQMLYDSEEPNAMILPLPVRDSSDEKNFQFVDLSDYPKFFNDLDRGFPFIAPQFSIGCSQSKTVTSRSLDLKVEKVGNYIASLVPTIADFSRLDPRFRLADGIWNKLPKYRNYAFAVFQLEKGNLKPHPMAMKFASATKEIFFPTLHIHDGEIHDREAFEHELYLQHASLDAKVGRYRNSDVSDRATNLVRSQKTAKHFCDIEKGLGLVSPDLLVHRKEIEGDQTNQDTLFSFPGSPEVASATSPPDSALPMASLPWLALLASGKWFFHRRDQVQADSIETRDC